jgi:hypothetical protein
MEKNKYPSDNLKSDPSFYSRFIELIKGQSRIFKYKEGGKNERPDYSSRIASTS